MTWLTISKSVKKAASKGKQTAVAPPKKAKAASKGKGVSTAPPEDKEKASTSKSKGKGAARKNAAEANTEIGTFLFFIFIDVPAIIHGCVGIFDSRQNGRSRHVFQTSTKAL